MFDPSDTTRQKPTSAPSGAYAAITRVDDRISSSIVARDRPGTQYASSDR